MNISGGQILEFLIPEGGWIITGNDYEGIQFINCEPITKAQFEAGFKAYEADEIAKAKTNATAKSALLAKLGITEDEAKLLLS